MTLISPASDGVIVTTDELLEAININSAAFVRPTARGGDNGSVQIMRL